MFLYLLKFYPIRHVFLPAVCSCFGLSVNVSSRPTMIRREKRHPRYRNLPTRELSPLALKTITATNQFRKDLKRKLPLFIPFFFWCGQRYRMLLALFITFNVTECR
ncbi:hypothetical protein BY458DRAFT_515590 [Sporodiniella umbellata]|nr:hypothetical protein BY458DRAFT_515590 [Sporodiniella umbellata]